MKQITEKAPRNQTLTLTPQEHQTLSQKLYIPNITRGFIPLHIDNIINKTIHADLFAILDYLPHNFADLIILDPPYNLSKDFNGFKFSKTNDDAYYEYLQS